MEELRFLYVCKGFGILSMPLVRVDNPAQANIVTKRLKQIYPEIGITLSCTSDVYIDVPHFSDYTWD